jgi:hypothetical protein
MVDHKWKIRNRRHRTDIGKYSFVKMTILLWTRLQAEIVGTFPANQIRLGRGLEK